MLPIKESNRKDYSGHCLYEINYNTDVPLFDECMRKGKVDTEDQPFLDESEIRIKKFDEFEDSEAQTCMECGEYTSFTDPCECNNEDWIN